MYHEKLNVKNSAPFIICVYSHRVSINLEFEKQRFIEILIILKAEVISSELYCLLLKLVRVVFVFSCY